jgi:ribosomal protein S12 methylthiotransferase accessory factor YcaO
MANDPGASGKTLELLQAALQGEYEVHALDVHDYPLFLAFAAPVNESVTGRKPRLPAGRGLTRLDALTGAAAEAIELRSSLAHRLPQGLHKFRKADGHDRLQVRSLVDQCTITVPAQQVFLDYAACSGEKLLEDADSTGCAAASTLAAAYQRGLLECIERDAVASWWYGRQSRAHLPLMLLDTVAPRISWWLSRRSRSTMLVDLTSDVRVPCVAAVSSDSDGLNVAIGSAAALSTSWAVLSAVLEMLQAEVTMELGRGSSDAELANWRKRASTKTMPQFVMKKEATAPFQIAPQHLLKAVTDSGHTPYGIELTLPTDPLVSVRVIVPGFSALNRRINEERIATACGLPANGKYRFEMLEPF